MSEDRASARFYEKATFARIQLLTIEGLLDNAHPSELPITSQTSIFKKARVRATDPEPQALIPPLLSDLGLRVSLRFRGRFRTPSWRTWIADHFRIRIG